MLPSYIVLSVFTFLVSQGNVVYALPHNSYSSRSNYIHGKEARGLVDPVADSHRDLVTDSLDLVNPEPVQEKRLVNRELSSSMTTALTVLGGISSVWGTTWAAKHTIQWFMKSENREKLKKVNTSRDFAAYKGLIKAQAPKALTTKFITEMRAQFPKLSGVPVSDIEVAMNNLGDYYDTGATSAAAPQTQGSTTPGTSNPQSGQPALGPQSAPGSRPQTPGSNTGTSSPPIARPAPAVLPGGTSSRPQNSGSTTQGRPASPNSRPGTPESASSFVTAPEGGKSAPSTP